MCISASIIVFPQADADPAVIISGYTLHPEILLPGDHALLTVTIYNAETSSTYTSQTIIGSQTTTTVKTKGAAIDNIWIETATDSEGERVRGKLNYNNIGYIAPSASFTVSFELVVDTNISAGVYFPVVHVDLESSSYEDVAYPVPVQVVNTSVELIPSDVSSRMSISGSTDVSLTIANRLACDVTGVVVTAAADANVLLDPEEVFVGDLLSGGTETVSFTVKPLAVGSDNLSFTLFFDNGINQHTQTESIAVDIVDVLDVAPVLYSIPSHIQQGGSTRVRLEVYNAKTEAISGVIVTPVTDAQISPSQYFIGSMDPDDVFSASFDLDTTDIPQGNYTLSFKVSFKQDGSYFDTPEVSTLFQVVAATESQNPLGVALPVCGFLTGIIVILLIYIWRLRRTKK